MVVNLLAALLLFKVLCPAAAYPLSLESEVDCSFPIIATPTYGVDGAVFSVCTSQIINGTPEEIYETLIDFRSYSVWNTFVVLVEVPANVSTPSDVFTGMAMTFHSRGLLPAVDAISTEIITNLGIDQLPVNVNWRADDGAGGTILRAEHVNLIENLGDGSSEYVSYETFYGPFAVVVKEMEDKLQTQFEVQGADLKRRVEHR